MDWWKGKKNAGWTRTLGGTENGMRNTGLVNGLVDRRVGDELMNGIGVSRWTGG